MPADPSSLFHAHQEKAAKLANKMRRNLPAQIGADEILSAALEGLWDACQRFDPARGWTFGSFAGRRIYGAVIDYVRQIDPLTRGQRKLGSVTIQRLPRELIARTPKPWEGLSLADLCRVLCRDLTPKQREAFQLYYVEGLTVAEAGRRIGIHQSRVSQLLINARPLMAEALARLEQR